MSYSKYQPDQNSIFVCKGNTWDFPNLETEPVSQHLTILKNPKTREFSGVEVKNFLTYNELTGMRAEERFKAMLEHNNVPFLYIGQGPFGLERSGVLIEQSKSKRADFLVNIPNMGTLLFDVKCRTKQPLKATGERYFTLFLSEIEALHNLQKLVMLPVWLAFFDRKKIEVTSGAEPYYFIPIIVLRKFLQGMQKIAKDENELQNLLVVRIPNELLKPVTKKMIFDVGYVNIKDELMIDFAKKHIGYIRRMKDKIKSIIREEQTYKTRIASLISKEHEEGAFHAEINYFVEQMIEAGIIEYETYKPLKLYGEY
jgi:hypothetical protein